MYIFKYNSVESLTLSEWENSPWMDNLVILIEFIEIFKDSCFFLILFDD